MILKRKKWYEMTETEKSKKQFLIFLLIAYGVTCVMGILTCMGVRFLQK